MLRYAGRFVPFYAGRLRPVNDAGVEQFWEEFQKVPLLTRADVRRERARLVATRGDTATWQTVHTSGSTGEPLEVVLDRGALATEARVLGTHLDRLLGHTDWRSLDVIHLVLHSGALSRSQPALPPARGRVTKWNLIRIWQLGEEAFFQALRQLDGCVVTTMPSVAELIASRWAGSGRPAGCSPAALVLSGEMLAESQRCSVRAAFNCPITAAFTLAEFGIVGTECASHGGFHVEPATAQVEILKNNGRHAGPGEAGRLVVTGLANRAMPLIRYVTGDRVGCPDTPCTCGRKEPRFLVIDARRPTRLVTRSGAAVNTIRFAKIFGELGLESYALNQPSREHVSVVYKSRQPIPAAAHDVIASAVRCALGPATAVKIERRQAANLKGVGSSPKETPLPAAERGAEPDGPGLDELVRWLQGQLAGEPEVEIALLTGSALSPETKSRYSDLDLVLFGPADSRADHWVSRARDLRQGIPQLSVMYDVLRGLGRRVPLFACRLLCEQRPVIGELLRRQLPWPRREDLCIEARFWSQRTMTVLRHRRINPPSVPTNTVHEAWQVSKWALDALRYRQLLAGATQTGALAVVSAASNDSGLGSEWWHDLVAMLEVAREHRPPPLANANVFQFFLGIAIHAVRALSRGL